MDRSKTPFTIDSGVKVLLITAAAYESVFLYEYSYLMHFGVPAIFVDVSLHELLFGGFAGLLVIAFTMWLDMFWSVRPTRIPPRLAQSLMILFLLSIAVFVLSVLFGVALILLFALLATLFLCAGTLLIVPLIRHRHLPKVSYRYWATFGGDPAVDTKPPTLLWFAVSKSILTSIGALVVTGVFALGLGTFHANVQSDFPVHDPKDNCAVLRLSSEGYLCVGIDFRRRVPLGTVRFLDPKSTDIRMLKIGRVAAFVAAAPYFAPSNPISPAPSPGNEVPARN